MEAVVLVEHLFHLVDLQKRCPVAFAQRSRQVGDLVLLADESLLSQHTQGGGEHILCRDVLLLVDGDVVEETNLNRQLIATRATLGQPKSEVARARALSIRPDMVIDARHAFYDAQTTGQFDLSRYDWVVDAIDTVSSKLLLIEQARAAGAKVISCMGAGNKLYTEFEIADIEKTSVCPLARRMRTELKKRGIQGVLAVYSKEPPLRPQDGERAPASISYVPGAAGLTLAGAVIRDLLGR